MNSSLKYLSCFAIIFQICGLQYFAINTLSCDNQKKGPSKFYKVYFVLVFVILTGQMAIFASVASAQYIDMPLNAKTVINYIIQHSMYIGLIIIICVSLIQSYTSTTLLKMFYLNYIEIARICVTSFRHRIDHQRIHKEIFKFFLFVMSFYFGAHCIVNTYELSTVGFSSKNLLSFMPLVFLDITVFKFIFCVKLVNFQIEKICELLTDIFSPPLSIIDNVNIYVKPRNSLKLKKKFEMSIKIKNLKRIYYIVVENCDIINRSMGFTVLCIVSVMVIVITSSGYQIFLTVLGKVPSDRIAGETYNIALSLLKTVFLFQIWSGVLYGFVLSYAVLILVIFTCDSTQQKVIKFLDIVK